MSENEKSALEIAREELEVKAKTENDSRKGKGTRLKVGATRGKNPQAIMFEEFDKSLPETLPANTQEFMEITKVDDDKVLLSYLIDGYNDAMYTAASDPIAEYVEPTWPDDVQKGFRIVVRNYASNAEISIEDAVAIIKPGIVKAQAKAAEKAAQAAPATT